MSFYGSKFGFYETTQESTVDDGRTFDFDQDLDGDKEFRSSVDEATVIVWSALNMQRMFEAVDIDIDEALSGFDEGSALAPIYTNKKKDDGNSSEGKSDSGEKKQDDAGETLRKSKLKKAFNTILQKLQNAISIVFNKISELITRACNRLAYWSNKMSASVWLKSNKSRVIEAAKNSNKKFSTAEFDFEGFNQMIQNVEDNHFTILARTAGSNFDQLSLNIHQAQQDTKVDKFDAGFGRVALLMFMSAIKDNKPAQSQLNSIMRGGEITYDNLRSVIKYNLSKNTDDVDAVTAADKSIKEIENIPKYIHGIEQVRVLITKFKNQTNRAINILRRELNNNDLFTGEDKTKEIRNCITIYRSVCTNAWSIEFTLCSGALECVSNCKWIAQETCKALLGKQTAAEP